MLVGIVISQYYRTIPRGKDGLRVAGRCISGSHLAMAAYRVTGNCCSMGEAAGKAAAYVKNMAEASAI